SSASRKVGDLLSRNRSTLPTSRDESDGRRARSSAPASRAAFRSPFSRPNTSQISRPISKRVGYDRVATWKIPVARRSNKSNAVRAAAGAYEGETRWSVKSGTGCRRRSSSRIQVKLFVFLQTRPTPTLDEVQTNRLS